jgi:CheY-like chemotaxis protein
MNPEEAYRRYQELQAWVGWTEDSARRVAAVAGILDAYLPALVDDFYDEIQRHPNAAKVITGGAPQIQRLKGTLVQWLRVVDDDPDLCANLWDLLHERSYRVHVAHDETEARRRLEGQAFDVVLIDMKLPRGNGASVFRLVRQTNPQARTVVITGHRSETDQLVRQVVAEGANAVCYKPFDVPRLLSTLELLTAGQPSKGGTEPV